MRETYVRGRVTVPMKSMGEHANCVAMLVADTGVASTFLGDSEPPAHDRWLVNRLKVEYAKPEEPLNRIKYALRDLLQVIEDADDAQPFKDAFTDYLWTDKTEDDDKKDPKPRPPKVPDIDIPPPKPNPHRLNRIEGGFSYAYQPNELVDAETARIVVSYRRRAGARKVTRQPKFGDFDERLAVDEEGSAGVEQDVEAQRVVFRLSNVTPGYQLRVTGFDVNRDLELRLEASDQ
jgi:hypothetical protein